MYSKEIYALELFHYCFVSGNAVEKLFLEVASAGLFTNYSIVSNKNHA